MALGAEGAQKMKQFFAVDSATVIDAFPWRPLWDDQLIGASDITAESQYQLPSIKLQGVTHPFLSILNQCVESNDADRLLWVLRGGLATSLPSAIVSEHILPWLFNLACSFGIRDDVAITSVNISVNIIRTFNWQECQFPLTFMHFLSPILSLGPLTSAVSVFDLPNVAISPPHDPITRNIILGRIIFVVQSMSQLNAPLPSPEKLTIFCLLLYLEPSTPAYLRRNLSLFLDDMIDSVSADRSLYDDGFVLVLCRKVVDSVSGFRLIEKYQILNCLFGGHATSRHFRRWLAIGLLQPDVVQSLQWPQFKQPPSLLPLVSLLDTKTNSSSPLRISAATNYGDLFHQIEIIGIALTDVRIYDVQATEMDKVLAGLEYLHGRIDDARAAFLDRTRVKDAIQRMRYRVLYQFQHKTKATIDSMFQR
ncbi:hypothetical protein FRC17_008236 [Serendipita sp. 399]|nr:hypothetical protein FRC17_008236 [Serendipita sp. 399]